METLAERYGWTLEDMKKIPQSEMDVFLQIIRTRNKIQEVERRKNKRK